MEVQFGAHALFANAAILAELGSLVANPKMLQHRRVARDGARFLGSAPGGTGGADGKCAAAQHLVGDGVAGPGCHLALVGHIVGDHGTGKLPVELVQHRRDAQHVGHAPLHAERLLPVGPDDVEPHAIGLEDGLHMRSGDAQRSRVIQRDIETLN
jgi:hypothetical protein